MKAAAVVIVICGIGVIVTGYYWHPLVKDPRLFHVTSYDVDKGEITLTKGSLLIRAKCDETEGCQTVSALVGHDITVDQGAQHLFIRYGDKVGEQFLIEELHEVPKLP
jgi:hypothetical protein